MYISLAQLFKTTLFSSMTRLVNFDIAKAIAIILVVIGHYYPENAPEWYRALHSWIYTFHMPLFMFASGYIYLSFKKDEGYFAFIKKKFRRLLVPYFIVSIIIISIKLLTQQNMHVENPVTPEAYIHILYLPAAGYFLWFIWSLFTCFLIIPFFKTPKARLILLGVAILLHYLFTLKSIELFAINETSRNLLWFVVGTSACDYGKAVFTHKLWEKHNNILKALILILFIATSILFLQGTPYTNEVLSWIGIAATMSISTWVADIRLARFTDPLLVIESASYIIYLFHTTFEGLAKSIAQKAPLFAGSDTGFILGAIVCILAGIVGPVILFYVIRRFQVTRIIFGLK